MAGLNYNNTADLIIYGNFHFHYWKVPLIGYFYVPLNLMFKAICALLVMFLDIFDEC